MILNEFINKGIGDIAASAGRFYLGDRKGNTFMLQMFSSLRKSADIREKYEQKGTHIPPFLIASIASNCNLHCRGCYARANGVCDNKNQEELDLSDWQKIFWEASEIGVSFIMLAGGEPLLRRDIIKSAANYKNIIFPIFTNGTIMDEEYLDIFDTYRNLIPVLSIEGSDTQTDERRGLGVSGKVWQAAEQLKKKGILYGASITVTSENKNNVTEFNFVNDLHERGCGLIFYVEYVPAQENTEYLALTGCDMLETQLAVDRLRNDKRNKGIIILSFPGDEDAMGGCLAAGRGFFHINTAGGAEPCPFSPFSVMNLKKQSLISVLQSPFFSKVREISAAEALNHKGGCTLFKRKDEVISAISMQ